MSVGRERKDPAATETYSLDFTNDLAPGDTLTGAPTWTFETADDGLITTALTKAAQSNTTVAALIRVSGGVDGATYYLKCSAPTTLGDTLVRRLLLDVVKE